jgi:hypothetical protein
VALASLGCAGRHEATAREQCVPDVTRPDAPFVWLHRYSGYDADGSGPVVGIWPDGRIVRVVREDQIGSAYVEGKLTPAELDGVQSFVAQRRGLLRLVQGPLAVDVPSERLGIRLRDRRVHYDENLGDLMQVHHDPDVAALRKHLMSLEVAEARPAATPWVVPGRDWLR